MIHPNGIWEPDGLTKGRVYTVRAVGRDPFWDTPGLWLNEIQRPIEEGYEQFGELSFHQCRFRPIVEKKTDISIFTTMLTPKKVKADA